MDKRVCLLLLFICKFLGYPLAQAGDEILHEFTLRQVNNTVQIDFAVRGGASCQGVQLQRSSDSQFFAVISEIQGVCGGSEFVEHYTIVDHSPLEYSTNYYRLNLGGEGLTETRSIDFVRLENDYRVYPQPSSDWAVLKYENPTESVYSFSLYSPAGTLIYNQSVSSSELFIDLNGYANGCYTFQLVGKEQELITGKIMLR